MSDFKDANRDPLTNEPGAHPIGTGVGAAGGAVAGAATGAGGSWAPTRPVPARAVTAPAANTKRRPRPMRRPAAGDIAEK